MAEPSMKDWNQLNEQSMKDWKQLNEQFQQAQDQIEFLTKSNDTLWKVISFLMEHI